MVLDTDLESIIHKLFHSATFKSTLIYLGILSFICIFFSYNWYTVATEELNRNFERQRSALINRPRFISSDVAAEILGEASERYEQSRQAVLSRIIVSNIILISAGSIGSYYLARRTLDPIEKAHLRQIRFTADASHELRTPIASMRTEIDVALRDPKLTKSEAIELLKSNNQELIKLTKLSEGLLKLANYQENQELNLEKVSVDALVEKSIDRLEKTAKLKNITITYPNCNQYVNSNFDAMHEILSILIDNAIKYSPNDSTITINVKVSKSVIKISVTDRGIGIEQDDLSKIFDRFYRADQSRTSGELHGNGLGLSIAKQLSDIYNAHLEVSSEGKGMGSIFSITMPKQQN